MKYLLILIVLIAITIAGCNNPQLKPILVKDTVVKVEREDKHEALLPGTIFLSKKAYSEKDNNTNLLKNIPEDFLLREVVYEKIKKNDEALFCVEKNLFRIRRKPDDDEFNGGYNSTMILEKNEKKEWKTSMEFVKGRGLFFEDANLDGYPDLFVKDHWNYRVYLYKPSNGNFSVSNICVEETTEILSINDKLFYSIESTQTVDHESYLFKYKNDKPYIYYLSHCIKGSNESNINKAKEVKLYKCKTGDCEKKTFLKNLYPVDEFASDDSVPFWRKNWKRLIKEY
ncbi:hypothetical protein ACI6Q2_10290 [Chitinophagaceae bacterium LWZ2-11]